MSRSCGEAIASSPGARQTALMDQDGHSGEQESQEATARRSYNAMSRVYGLLSDSSEKRFVRTAIEELLRPSAGEHILEPGFGAGQVLVALAELVGEDGHIDGIDISDGMVAQARKRVARAGLEQRVSIRQGSVTALPYKARSFDAVFMSFTLELFSDELIPAVLAQIRRVLKPTGRLCVACMSAESGNATMEKLYRWSHRRFPHFVDCRPIAAATWLTRTGFEITQRRTLDMWGLGVDLLLADVDPNAAHQETPTAAI